MGRASPCAECYRLWQQYITAIMRQGTDDIALRRAAATADGVEVTRLREALELSTRALGTAREEMATHVAEHAGS